MMKKYLTLLSIFCIVVPLNMYGNLSVGTLNFNSLNIKQGLSNNHITSFCKSTKGYLWIGTEYGLNRFNGYGVQQYLNNPSDDLSLRNNTINSLFEDAYGYLWVMTNTGYCIFDPVTETFTEHIDTFMSNRDIKISYAGSVKYICGTQDMICYSTHDSGIIIENVKDKQKINIPLSAINDGLMIGGGFDLENRLWVVTNRFEIYLFDLQTSYKKLKLFSFGYSKKSDNLIAYVGREGDLWLIDKNKNTNLYHIRHNEKITSMRSVARLPDNAIFASITEDLSGNIWIGTDHDGIYIYDPQKNETKNIRANSRTPLSLSQNSIVSLFCDNKGIVWVGTYKHGVNYYHPSIFNFMTYTISPENKEYNDINSIVEDKSGNLLLGTNGKGVYKYNPQNSQINYIPCFEKKGKREVIVRVISDNKNRLWVGTYRNGLYGLDNGKKEIYSTSAPYQNSLPEDNIWALSQDRQGNIWIGTLNSGVCILDPDKKDVVRLTSSDITKNCIRCISMLKDYIAVGTLNGLILYTHQGQLIKEVPLQDKNDKNPSVVVDVQQSRSGYVWIATNNGIILATSDFSDYVYLNRNDDILSGIVNKIIIDLFDNVWFSSHRQIHFLNTHGLKDITKWTPTVVTFDQKEGVNDNEYNENCGIITRDHKIIFGGVNGINIIEPDKLLNYEEIPQLEFTRLYINNRPVMVGEKVNGHIPQPYSFYKTNDIKLNHNENSFALEFQPINFFNHKKYNYQYQLKGFKDDWVNADDNNLKAIFTNLNYGEYTLNVRICSGDQVIEPNALSMTIHVLSPLWERWWAKMIYLIACIIAAYFIYRNIQRFRQLRNVIREKEIEKRRTEEMNTLKIKLFTNLSHELRTPLTLITSPVEELKNKVADKEIKSHLDLINRNAKRLLFIVNQLLDFRKIEMSEITLHQTSDDIVRFTTDTADSFIDMAEKKQIHFVINSSIESLMMNFDSQKYERILFNLLSNAFKFTEPGGDISVSMDIDESNELFVLRIADTGIGIPKENLANIFKRFFQSDTHSIVNQGSGIGLSITQEFVNMHKGTIVAESEEGVGSTFIVSLPIIQLVSQKSEKKELKTILDISKVPQSDTSDSDIAQADKKKTILIVEDNEDLRFYIKENLRNNFTVYDAKDGREGLAAALSIVPDIIISDVVMPYMDGLELCKAVKTDPRISHIPILLLTARISDAQQLEGLECGADDYLTKPFNINILNIRINNIFKIRDNAHKKNNSASSIQLSEIEITSLDEKTLKKVIHIIEEKMNDPVLTVEYLSREVGMSNVYLNRKLNALVGKSASELIRSIRLKRATQLLEKSGMMVSEIAYEVGFNNPRYFTKYFKDEYGMLPVEYRKKMAAESETAQV